MIIIFNAIFSSLKKLARFEAFKFVATSCVTGLNMCVNYQGAADTVFACSVNMYCNFPTKKTKILMLKICVLKIILKHTSHNNWFRI